MTSWIVYDEKAPFIGECPRCGYSVEKRHIRVGYAYSFVTEQVRMGPKHHNSCKWWRDHEVGEP